MGQFDDNYIDHRNDANANDPDSVSSEWSAFVFVRQVCPTGVAATQQTFKIKLVGRGRRAAGPLRPVDVGLRV